MAAEGQHTFVKIIRTLANQAVAKIVVVSCYVFTVKKIFSSVSGAAIISVFSMTCGTAVVAILGFSNKVSDLWNTVIHLYVLREKLLTKIKVNSVLECVPLIRPPFFYAVHGEGYFRTKYGDHFFSGKIGRPVIKMQTFLETTSMQVSAGRTLLRLRTIELLKKFQVLRQDFE